MSGCTLHAPNSDRFSDDVIGSVVYRAKRSCFQTVHTFDAKKSKQPVHDQLHGLNPTVLPSCVEAPQEIHSEKRKISQDISNNVCHNRSHTDVICQDSSPLPIASIVGPAAATRILLLGKKIKRAKWRRNQQRYRTELQCIDNDECMDRGGGFGLQSNAPAAASALMATPSSDQFDCVRSVMAPSVVFNTGRGENHVIQSWRRFSLWFDDIVVDLNELQKLDSKSVLAITRTSVTITEQTLRYVFPHLYDEASPRLAPKLLNQRIVVEGWARFEWDRASHRVTSITSESDLLTPIRNLVDSLEDVCLSLRSLYYLLRFQWKCGDSEQI
ncbi:unnamed protein product [Phytophthora fragariaefolia]|uniref:Unnamed protein product n=1 Tax=Phytophthora fragariaefolia TaxID=1490495 RepID=A0A9W6YFP8_9STRA|nr:unnamed protein product [Phytophthora fragariaefolia]